MTKNGFSKLSRPLQQMPEDVKESLEKNKLMEAYQARPPYQQNNYLSWISRARRPETKQKRLSQMLFELDHGGLYMKMKHNPSVK